MSVVLIVHFQTKKGKDNEVENLSKQLAEISLQEMGCLSFKITRSRGDKHAFIFFEEYSDLEAAMEHQRSVHYKDFVIGRILPCVVNRKIYIQEGLV